MNQDLVSNLGILARYYNKINDNWRKRAYQQAIIAIKGMDTKITTISDIKNIRGIGKSIRNKIKEYLDSGEIRKVEEIKNIISTKHLTTRKDSVIDLFQHIWGVGPIKAAKLYSEGLRTINDVKHNQHLLTRNQKIGLKYYDELLELIPRACVRSFEHAMRSCLTQEFGNTYKLKITGSYRRGHSSSGDIDCLISSETFNLEQMMSVLTSCGLATDSLGMRNEKFMGIVKCQNRKNTHFRLDVEFLPKNEWGSGLLYFTGSKSFNMLMRTNAKRKGLILNQHGLFDKDGNRIHVYSEKEIMHYLGMRFVKPKDR